MAEAGWHAKAGGQRQPAGAPGGGECQAGSVSRRGGVDPAIAWASAVTHTHRRRYKRLAVAQADHPVSACFDPLSRCPPRTREVKQRPAMGWPGDGRQGSPTGVLEKVLPPLPPPRFQRCRGACALLLRLTPLPPSPPPQGSWRFSCLLSPWPPSTTSPGPCPTSSSPLSCGAAKHQLASDAPAWRTKTVLPPVDCRAHQHPPECLILTKAFLALT